MKSKEDRHGKPVKVLCLDHICHKRTGSFDFFIDLLLEGGCSVEVFYYERHYHVKPPCELVEWADVVLYWEFLPSRYRLTIPGKRIVFVPMYDNEWGSYWQWKRIAWSGIGVISFCDKVTEHAKRCGVADIIDVRYFPDPAQFSQESGAAKRVFLWERGDISEDIVKKLFPPELGYTFDVKRDDEFLERGVYLKRLAKCDVFIAPRRKEGIGMAFLEAMAMCKCVAAFNDGTMNEYVKDGETGILFDAFNLSPVSPEKVERIKSALPDATHDLRLEWNLGAVRILPFIKALRSVSLSFTRRLELTLAYPLYLAEGAFYRLRERFCS
jgi:hypothetical protein